ncbi:hypothetical protein QFZ81_000946 [Paenibacillus sp. V4I9]|uniref:DUF6220 domain-containing protein n=1 Tax=Paenibacillus sp. V4I9 TaxID=3042308 RepID=UPI00277F38DA|nr:DUF6220 domain-containing protein [Paenibacillus sp. V4I9]MDQ0885858.1 hypothetical protein [Paenibacillus sp. V4I9]
MAKQMNRAEHLAENNTNISSGASKTLIVIKWMARVYALMIAMQVFIAGMATFTNSDWTAHTNFAHFFVIPPVLMILLWFFARPPVTYLVKSLILLVMVILMFVTAVLSFKIGVLSAFHPVIALAMFWNAMKLARQAGARSHKDGI